MNDIRKIESDTQKELSEVINFLMLSTVPISA